MDKEVITRAAEEAIGDLQLDCEITDVTKPLGKDSWCILFTGSYGQFCDAFHDKEGKDNSAPVIREKIKRYFLKQRKPARIVRGRNPSATARRSQESNLLGTLLDAGEGMLKQASRIAGEVVERAANLNRTVLETEAEWVETVSPTMAEVIRPDSPRKSVTEVSPPQRIIEPVSAQPPKRVAQSIKSERKAAAGTGGRTKKKTTTTKARTTKKTGSHAPKKAKASAVTAKKSVTKKKGTTTGKKTSKKKSSSKKSRTAIRNFY